MTRTEANSPQHASGDAGFQRLMLEILTTYLDAKSRVFGGASPVASAFGELQTYLAQSAPVESRETIRVVTSYGKGNWATIPWVTFLDQRETTTTQVGLYAGLLWRGDMTGVYLVVMQGVTDPLERLGREGGRRALEAEGDAVRESIRGRAIPDGFELDGAIDLRSKGRLARGYVQGVVGYKLYAAETLPSDEEFSRDLEFALGVVESRIEARPAPKSLDVSKALAIYVGESAEPNLARGLDRGVWGWKDPQTTTNDLPVGSLVGFGVRYTDGSPRVPLAEWLEHGLRRVVVARTTGPAYVDDQPVWDDEHPDGKSYPYRLPIEYVGEIAETPLRDGAISPELAEAFKRSVSGGRAVVVDADLSELLQSESWSPSTANELRDSFRLAVEESGMVLGPEGEARVDSFVAAVLTKPFVVLSGLSGSGKTQLAMRLGEWFGSSKAGSRLLPVAVRPDWTGPEALLGYEDALRAVDVDGRAAWFVPATLRFLLRAVEEPSMPFLMLLDEMNLAHVERYFSDFLSGMETRLPTIPNLVVGADGEWRTKLGGPATVPIPRNVVVVGTVNVDETTYLFSPKVLDRAMTFEVRTRTDELIAGAPRPRAIGSASGNELRSLAALISDDEWHREHPSDHQEYLAGHLRALHADLVKSGDEFGHRLFYDSLRLAAAFQSLQIVDRERVLDQILLLKILPRLHGARRRIEPVLITLRGFAQDPDSWRPGIEIDPEAGPPRLVRAAHKLDRMLAAVRVNQFVSFTE